MTSLPLQSQQAHTPAFKRAVALFEQGKVSDAIEGYKEVLQADINNASAWVNLGMALRQTGRLEAALACSKRALELSPQNPSYLTNHGNCLVDLDREEEALAAHAEAACLRPGDFLIERNYAIALRNFCKYEEALAHFTAAQKIRPADESLTWEIAICLLYLGRFEEGWKAFEARWKQPQLKERTFDAPRWKGENISGKTLFIHEEQGFGDTILCSRYIRLVKERGANVILECKEPLRRLFSFMHGIDCLAEPGQQDLAYDYQIPIMSLPGVFGTDLDTIPPPTSFLVPSALPPKAAQLLAIGENRFKVGIVWSGSVTFANNRRRAADATRFLSLAGVPNVQLYSLQKGPREADLAGDGLGTLVLDLGPHLRDFADTAAVLKKLDLVIMTDSAVAHLAGSLGTPVWNLLSYNPYWLYLSGREDSPWYSSMRLFRQPQPGDWDSVFSAVAGKLEKVALEKIQK